MNKVPDKVSHRTTLKLGAETNECGVNPYTLWPRETIMWFLFR